jgi:hypothetical protein
MAMPSLHAAVGIAVVKLMPEYPIVGIVVAFISHFVVDLYPEWYKKSGKPIESIKSVRELYIYICGYSATERLMIGIEVLLAIGVIGALWHVQSPMLWYGAMAALLPDIIEAVNVKLLKRRKLWFCHGGSFPFRVKTWQGFGMGAIQTAVLDTIFTALLVLLTIQ